MTNSTNLKVLLGVFGMWEIWVKKIKATGYLVGKIGRGILRSHKTRCSV